MLENNQESFFHKLPPLNIEKNWSKQILDQSTKFFNVYQPAKATTPLKWSEEIKQWANGYQIQESWGDDHWYTIHRVCVPDWTNPSLKFRVKPE